MRQLIRYGLVGATSNTVTYLSYLFLTYLGIEPKAAMTFVYVIGASIGFIGNRKWTFSHRGDLGSAAQRYVAAHACGYLLNFLILLTFVDRLGFAHHWVQAVAMIIVAGFLFLVSKYFVFSRKTIAPQRKT